MCFQNFGYLNKILSYREKMVIDKYEMVLPNEETDLQAVIFIQPLILNPYENGGKNVGRATIFR